MNLDERVHRASVDLLDRTRPQVDDAFADLMRRKRRGTAVRVGAVAALAAAVAGAGALLAPPEPPPEPVNPHPRVATLTAQTGFGAVVQVPGPQLELPPVGNHNNALDFTRDGTGMVYSNLDESLDHRVSLVDLGSGEVRDLGACHTDLCDADLSPDGSTLAFSDENGLVLVDTSDATSRRLDVDPHRPAFPSWSPDGTRLALRTEDEILVVDTDDGSLTSVWRSSSLPRMLSRPSWSPDGTRLAILDGVPMSEDRPDFVRNVLLVVDVETGQGVRVIDAGACYCVGISAPVAAWSPDGDWIAVSTVGGATPRDAGAHADGLYLVRPDGSGLHRIAQGAFTTLAWRPGSEEK
jgi:dipeptidyl aminopeptidase/acylaminoacyl peptidase